LELGEAAAEPDTAALAARNAALTDARKTLRSLMEADHARIGLKDSFRLPPCRIWPAIGREAVDEAPLCLSMMTNAVPRSRTARGPTGNTVWTTQSGPNP